MQNTVPEGLSTLAHSPRPPNPWPKQRGERSNHNLRRNSISQNIHARPRHRTDSRSPDRAQTYTTDKGALECVQKRARVDTAHPFSFTDYRFASA